MLESTDSSFLVEDCVPHCILWCIYIYLYHISDLMMDYLYISDNCILLVIIIFSDLMNCHGCSEGIYIYIHL
jgi:hypothetical protein